MRLSKTSKTINELVRQVCKKIRIPFNNGFYRFCERFFYKTPPKQTKKIEDLFSVFRRTTPFERMLFLNEPKELIVSSKEPLTPKTKKKFLSLPGVKLKRCTQTPSGYKRMIRTSGCSVFKKDSPFKGIVLKTGSKNTDNSNIIIKIFTIKRDDIRIHTKPLRHISQNRIMGKSAKTFLEERGAELNGQIMHWCHSRGLCLGGEQSKENMMPGTKGSNYYTLAFLEAPLMKLFSKRKVSKVQVKVKISMATNLPIPKKIDYNINWGNTRFVHFAVYPFSGKTPSLIESRVANLVYSINRSPEVGKSPCEREVRPSTRRTLF